MKIRADLLLLLACAACGGEVIEAPNEGSGGAPTTSTTGATGEGGAGQTTNAATTAGTSSAEATTGGGGEGGVVVSPSPEECEALQTEEDCLSAGCALWFPVLFAVRPGEPDTCADATAEERSMCFQLDPNETYSYPAAGLWKRETDDGLEHMYMASSYCGLLGWSPCYFDKDDPLGPDAVCICSGNPCDP